MNGLSDLPGMLRPPIVKREPRLRGALRRFVGRLVIVERVSLAEAHVIMW